MRLLNELDEQLTAEELPVRIVFLIYVDLLWPPETERIQQPDRFILMFAPITRTYSRPFTAAPAGAAPPALPPYERNRLTFPRDVDANVAFLRAWQRLFQGDSFDFDYHFMWDHYKDPGAVAIAEVLHQDIRGLAALGLNGLVSCQVQRAFFPTGLGMAVMGHTLWNKSLEFDALAEDYFRSAFGADGLACLEYCRELSRLFDPPYLRGEKPRRDAAVAEAYTRLPAAIASFRPVIQRNLDSTDPCHARSWHYLDAHAEICLHLAQALRHRAAGDDQAAAQAWAAAERLVQEREPALHAVLDVYEFTRVLGALFRSPRATP